MLQTYPLVASALGRSHPLELTGVAQAGAWALESWEVPVTFRMSGLGWLVHGPAGFLGLVPTDVVQRYPDMSRVFRSGFTPAARARLAPSEDGSGRMRAWVDLPAPPFVVPLGSVSSPVLAQGEALALDPAMDFDSPAQLLVELDLVGPAVAARFKGRLLGGSPQAPAYLVEALNKGPLAARAFVSGPHAALDISPQLMAEDLPALRVAELQHTVPGADSAPLIAPDRLWLDSASKRR